MTRVADMFPPGWLDLFDPAAPRIAAGLDLGTTTKAKSNPTVFALTQQVQLSYLVRLMLRFKTNDPEITEAVIRLAIEQLRGRGLRVRKLGIDATSERFFAVRLRKDLAGLVPVKLIIKSESIIYLGEKMLVKSYLGNLFVNTIDDGYLGLPGEEWVKKDIRQVVRDRGTFDADVADDGGHADGFDAVSFTLDGLISKGGPVEARAARVGGSLARPAAPPRALHNPFANRFDQRPAQLR